MGPVLGSHVSTTSRPRLLIALARSFECVVLPQPSMPSTTTNRPGKRRPESEMREMGGSVCGIAGELLCSEFFCGRNRRRILTEHGVVYQARLTHESGHGEHGAGAQLCAVGDWNQLVSIGDAGVVQADPRLFQKRERWATQR